MRAISEVSPNYPGLSNRHEIPFIEIGRSSGRKPRRGAQSCFRNSASGETGLRDPTEAFSVLKGEPSPVHRHDLEQVELVPELVFPAHVLPLGRRGVPETTLDLTHLVRPTLVVPGVTAVIDESITAVCAVLTIGLVILSMRLML